MGTFGVVLLMCLIGQAPGPELSRFGSLGRRLKTSEVAEIGDIANGIGKRPWLMLGHRSMMLGVANIDVFLQPDAKGAQVSRGRMLALIADDPPAAPRRSAWRVRETKPYAYIASSGRQPFHIIDERDVDWPFAIEGDIDDATLLSLVLFIRSWPRLPGVPEGQNPRQVYAAPIAVVARRADTIIVGLRTGEHTGQRVTVVQENGAWTITHFEQWVV